MNTKPRQGKQFFVRLAAILIFLLAIAAGAYQGWKFREEKKAEYLSGKNIVYRMEDVLGVQTATASVTVDFGKQIATGSPLVFGGAHAPKVEHQDAWNKLKESGITVIRRDFYIEFEVPRNITLADYKSNKNNVQDPSTWNTQKINETQDIYKNAIQRNMKTIGIVAYAPFWLTADGTNFGIPVDWDVYEDIVRKTYTIHRPYLDYVEIWNEPETKHFLHTTNTNLTPGQAYAQIVLHAIKAIREVDSQFNDGKRMQIGVGVAAAPMHDWVLEEVFTNPETKDAMDFVSYHNYSFDEPSNGYFTRLLSKYGKTGLPIFLTEWNKSSDTAKDNPYHTTELAISYTGSKLINFMKMGLPMTNYFSTTHNDLSKPNTVFSVFGIYRWENNTAVMLPQASTFKLLSITLKLGSGINQIFNAVSSVPTKLVAAGFVNSTNQRGIMISNENSSPYTINIKLDNYLYKSRLQVSAYIASSSNDGYSKKGNVVLRNKQEDSQLKLLMPANSVVGLLFQERSL